MLASITFQYTDPVQALVSMLHFNNLVADEDNLCFVYEESDTYDDFCNGDRVKRIQVPSLCTTVGVSRTLCPCLGGDGRGLQFSDEFQSTTKCKTFVLSFSRQATLRECVVVGRGVHGAEYGFHMYVDVAVRWCVGKSCWGLKTTEAGPCRCQTKSFHYFMKEYQALKTCTNPVGGRTWKGLGKGVLLRPYMFCIVSRKKSRPWCKPVSCT